MNVTLTRYSQKEIMDVREAFCIEDYSFTVDWLNVRLDLDNIDVLKLAICSAFPEIDIADFVKRESGGVCFYKDGEYLSTLGYSSFVISFNRDNSGHIINKPEKRGQTYGVLLSISGDGCRYINSLHENGFADFVKLLAPFNPHCSRIDVACDIFDKDNCIVPLIQTFADTAYERENALVDFNCNLNRSPGWVTANLVYDKTVNKFTRNITIGGRSSTKGTLQLYNKRVEIESGRLSEVSEAILNSVGNPDYWWRLEYRCKSFAQKVFMTLLETGSIYQAFLCAVNEMGVFVVAISNFHNIERADTCVEWMAFIAFLEKLCNGTIHLVQLDMVNIPYVGSELDRVRKFHTKQIAASDSINLLLLMLDKDYRNKVYRDMCVQLVFNKKLRPALQEISVKYGYKIPDIVDFVWQQSGFSDIA